jgi:hypothetical protein
MGRMGVSHGDWKEEIEGQLGWYDEQDEPKVFIDSVVNAEYQRERAEWGNSSSIVHAVVVVVVCGLLTKKQKRPSRTRAVLSVAHAINPSDGRKEERRIRRSRERRGMQERRLEPII